MPTYTGGCHCGRVRFRVTAELQGIADCNCSVCTKKGFLHLIVAPEQLELLAGARHGWRIQPGLELRVAQTLRAGPVHAGSARMQADLADGGLRHAQRTAHLGIAEVGFEMKSKNLS